MCVCVEGTKIVKRKGEYEIGKQKNFLGKRGLMRKKGVEGYRDDVGGVKVGGGGEGRKRG